LHSERKKQEVDGYYYSSWASRFAIVVGAGDFFENFTSSPTGKMIAPFLFQIILVF
jgi:hypothetical protein